MKLSFVYVQDWGQALDLMRVRNLCREGMTHDREVITVAQQTKFFQALLKADVYETYLLVDHDRALSSERTIGYGLLKLEDDRYWMTAGLVPAVRGQGLSRLIINFITEMGHRQGKDVWIDVADNNLALFGDIRTGYEFVNSQTQPDGSLLHVMRHQRDRQLSPREREWLSKHGHPQAPQMSTPSSEVDQLTEILEVDAISREQPEPFYKGLYPAQNRPPTEPPPPSYEVGPATGQFLIESERGLELPRWPWSRK